MWTQKRRRSSTALQNMTCGIALKIGSIVCSCVSTEMGTILKGIVVDFLNLLNRKSYRHSLVFFVSYLLFWSVFQTFHTFPCIQGVSRLEGITTGGDFLGLCDQKSSYKHVSDFGRLRSYGHFLIPVYVLVWTASYGTSWQVRVMYSTWWLIFCVVSIIFASWLAQFTTERQPLLRP